LAFKKAPQARAVGTRPSTKWRLLSQALSKFGALNAVEISKYRTTAAINLRSFSVLCDDQGRWIYPQNTRITVEVGSSTDSTAVPLCTKFKRVGVFVAMISARP
jgi:hypothetical protein